MCGIIKLTGLQVNTETNREIGFAEFMLRDFQNFDFLVLTNMNPEPGFSKQRKLILKLLSFKTASQPHSNRPKTIISIDFYRVSKNLDATITIQLDSSCNNIGITNNIIFSWI